MREVLYGASVNTVLCVHVCVVVEHPNEQPVGRADTCWSLWHCALPVPRGQSSGERLDGPHYQSVGLVFSAELDEYCMQSDNGWTQRHCTMPAGQTAFH